MYIRDGAKNPTMQMTVATVRIDWGTGRFTSDHAGIEIRIDASIRGWMR